MKIHVVSHPQPKVVTMAALFLFRVHVDVDGVLEGPNGVS